MTTDPLTLALHLATAIVGHLPEPDPELRRARYVGRLAHLVARLEALAADARARAHASRLERVRRERETRAADHWAD